MSSKEEEVAQVAKGLSCPQAQRAAAAASRNVNAYGQKEEGPSQWQERKEAKRQMCLMSTEKAVKLGVRKDLKSTAPSEGATQCSQTGFQLGHWTYKSKNERVYISRPSMAQQLKNPKLKMKISIPYELDNLGIPQSALDLQDRLNSNRALEKVEMKSKGKGKSQKKTNKAKRYSDDSSDCDSSEASVFSSDSGVSTEVSDSELDTSESISSDSESDSSETSFDSDSEEEQYRKKHRKRGHRQYSSSESDSDFGECQKKRRWHQKRCHARL